MTTTPFLHERKGPPYDPMVYRVRYLPRQLEAARRKVAALENEARRYNMTDLLGNNHA